MWTEPFYLNIFSEHATLIYYVSRIKPKPNTQSLFCLDFFPIKERNENNTLEMILKSIIIWKQIIDLHFRF